MANKKPNISFVLCAYAFFWIWFIIAAFLLGNEELFSNYKTFVSIVGPWAPTFALFVLFKKLYPGSTIKEFYKNAFKERLNLKLLLVFAALYLLAIVGAASITAYTRNVSLHSMFNLSLQSLVWGFVLGLTSGATGEESGWRGHLQPYMEKKYSIIKASVIVGIIWAFWHAPTWFTAGFVGRDLIVYIFFDILDKMVLAIIIGICYSRCRNLIVPIGMHFILNFFIHSIQESLDLYFYIWICLLEVVVAIGYIVWHTKISKKEIATV